MHNGPDSIGGETREGVREDMLEWGGKEGGGGKGGVTGGWGVCIQGRGNQVAGSPLCVFTSSYLVLVLISRPALGAPLAHVVSYMNTNMDADPTFINGSYTILA